MKKVILIRGLPASGKSTYAKQLVDENPNVYKRINRDDLRMMFDNGYTSNGNEKFVKKVRDILIVKALEEGKSVVVDDTNLSERNFSRISQLVEEFNKQHNDTVTVEVKEFDTPLHECIARDAQREKPVGERVIRDMHRQFFDDGVRYAQQDGALPKAIICDLDGTLALLNGRDPFNAAGCENDLLNVPVANTVKNYHALGYKVLLFSGRKQMHQPNTQRWLAQHNIPYDLLVFRKDEDNRKDAIIKREIFDAHVQGKFYIEFVLDDRNQVVNMWRDELKLPCYQVYYGDF
jgi:predicted kinase